MKLCLHRRGAQPRRKKVKKKQPPRVLTFRERLALERVQRARGKVGPAYVFAGALGAAAAMAAVLDAELAYAEASGRPVRGAGQ